MEANMLPEMVKIPAGTFWMGSTTGNDDEKPYHQVYLGTYWIGKNSVTNIQYQTFVDDTNHRRLAGWKNLQGKENRPVVNADWYDAMVYCAWLSKITGQHYTLPTEAQWEKAARGTDGNEYPWGDKWYDNHCHCNADTPAEGDKYPQGVSPYGCLDMVGNVWQWCLSEYRPYPYVSTDGRESTTGFAHRVARGGSYRNPIKNMRCAFRSDFHPVHGYYDRSFRVIRSSH